MDTRPSEACLPEPLPSTSTPTYVSDHAAKTDNNRPRRHTIAETDAALAMLTDSSADEWDEDRDHMESFHRISSILSNLIQEAKEAVHGAPENTECFQDLSSVALSSSPPSSSHRRSPSISSVSSTETLFSPLPRSGEEAYTPTSTPPTPVTVSKEPHTRSCSPIAIRSPSRPESRVGQDPLTESFQRLDSSLALVDSLSRDLASRTRVKQAPQPLGTPAISAFLLLPLLHIPHTLITMVFDSLSSVTHATPSQSPSDAQNLTGMFAWAFFFALANLMVDRVVSAQPPKAIKPTNPRRLSLPGTYTSTAPLPILVRPRRRCLTRRSYRKQRQVLLSGDVVRTHKSTTLIARSVTQPGHRPSQPDPTTTNATPDMKRRSSF